MFVGNHGKTLATAYATDTTAGGGHVLQILPFVAIAALWLVDGIPPGSVAVLLLWHGVTAASGLVVWRLAVRTRIPLVFEVGLAYGIGLALHVPTMLAVPGQWWQPWAAPGLVLCIALVVPRWRRRALRISPRLTLGQRATTAIALWVVVALAWSESMRSAPVSIEKPVPINIDALFALALARRSQVQLPMSSPFVAGDDLPYHWFASADIGLTGTATGVDPWVVLAQVWYPVVLALAALAVGGLTCILSRRLWAGPLATLTAGAVSSLRGLSFSSRPLLIMNHDLWQSPTMVHGLLMTSTLLALLLALLRARRYPGTMLVVSVATCTATLVVTKSTQVPLIVAGLATAAGAAALHRRWSRALRLAAVTLGTALVGGVMSWWAFHGSTDGLSVHPRSVIPLHTYAQRDPGLAASMLGLPDAGPGFSTGDYVLVGGVLLIGLFSATLYPLLAPLVAWRRLPPGDPMVPALGGSIVAGLAATLVLRHPGGSEIYFLVGTWPMVAALGSWGVVLLLRPTAMSLTTVALGLAVGATSAGAAVVVHALLPTRGWVLRALVVAGAPTLVVLSVLTGAVLLAAARPGAGAAVLVGGLAFGGLVSTGLTLAPLPRAGISNRGQADLPDGTRPKDLRPALVSPDLVRAARFVASESEPNAVIATNRHCSAGGSLPQTGEPSCAPDDVVLAAFTGRAMLVEGWMFERSTVSRAGQTFQNLSTIPFADQGVLAANDLAFTHPDDATRAGLCALGTRWAVVDHTVRGTASHTDTLGDVVMRFGSVDVIRLHCGQR